MLYICFSSTRHDRPADSLAFPMARGMYFLCHLIGFSVASALLLPVSMAQDTSPVVESVALLPGEPESAASQVNNDALQLLLDQNRQLQSEVQSLRGMVEEQGFELRKLQRDSLNRYTDTDERLRSLETGTQGESMPNPAAPATASTSGPSPAITAAAAETPITSPSADFPAMPSTGSMIADPATAGEPEGGPVGGPAGMPADPGLNQAEAAGNESPVGTFGNLPDTTAGTTAFPETAAGIPAINPPNRITAPLDMNSTPAADMAANAGNRNTPVGRSTLQPSVLSEQQLYQMAYDSVINSNFERSIAQFDQYLSIYPEGRFVTNGHYWKGQAFLYLEQFEEARNSYEIILDQFPGAAKVPDAMYGLALAYQGLGNLAQARQLLDEIKRRFPNTGVANLADTRLLNLN